MNRISIEEALGSAGFSARWILTGGGSAVLRVDWDGWTASIGPFGEDGRPEDPGYMSVLGYDYVPDDDMIGGESYVYDANVDSVADVVTAVIGLFGTDDDTFAGTVWCDDCQLETDGCTCGLD